MASETELGVLSRAEVRSGRQTKALVQQGLKPTAVVARKRKAARRADRVIMNLRSSVVYSGCTFSACQPLGPLTTLN